MLDATPTFSSFIMAGFECTAARAAGGKRLDLLGATRHDVMVEEDYQAIRSEGITTVREGLAWSTVDQGNGCYDFSRYEPLLAAGKQQQIQQIWDLNHFDYPDFVDPLSDDFVEHYRHYATAVVQTLRRYMPGQIYLVPLNEISFFAWIGADRGWWAPYLKGREQGGAFKKQLVKAALAAMDAIWQVDSEVRFIHVDPFMRRQVVEPATSAAKKHVRDFNESVRYEAWDMLCGRVAPELGGEPKYLDIIGVNYYIHNQEWVFSHQPNRRLRHQLMDWDSPDRISFAIMLQTLFERYHRPMIISETGSFGEHRAQWWRRVLAEVSDARELGLPVAGVCAYPVLDRPESAGFLLPNSGIWDFASDDLSCQRIPHQQSLEVLKKYRAT